MITINIFTRWKNEKLLDLISDLRKQFFKDFKIKIFSDTFFEVQEEIIFTENMNISQKRNLAISTSDTNFLFLLDDDNRLFDVNFLANLINTFKKVSSKEWECVVSPTIIWRDTDIIQSAGIFFCYFLWKVFASKKKPNDYKLVKWIWGNSLFWKTSTFKKASFDEKIWFIREDIDYSYSLREKWIKIIVLNQWINHIERDKTLAEKSFVAGNVFERKIKNRDIFVSKHGNFLQKLLYYIFWRWVAIVIWKIKRI